MVLSISSTPSSFSLVSREHLERLNAFQIFYVAQYYLGYPVDTGRYKLLPYLRPSQLLHYINTIKPNILVLHHSPKSLLLFSSLLDDMKNQIEKLVLMCPIEAYPMTYNVEPLFSKADLIITHSRYSQKCIEKQGYQAQVIPHGVSEIFSPSHNQPPNFTVGVVSSHVWRKQLTRIIDAHEIAKKQHPITLKIYASTYDQTSWMPNLKKYAEMTNPEVYLHESAYRNVPSPHEKMPEIYRQFTVLANPVTEGFGLTLLEAMASGVVPITIPHGSAPEVVGDCGIYAEISDYLTLDIGKIALVDIKDLAEKIIWAYENKECLRRLREQAIKRAKEFKWEKQSKKLRELMLSG